MPSVKFVRRIEDSLAPNERSDDFAYMFDTLVMLRHPYAESEQLSEEITGKILCVFTPDKPPKYRRAMQEFRLQFADISNDPRLRARFPNCVKNAALIAQDPNSISWTPSLYFRRPGLVKRGRYARLQYWY